MGCGGTGGSLPGLLPLDMKNPNTHEIFRSGDLEEDYEVEKDPIARGKFASVRLARHRITKEIFAAKFIRRRRRAANLEEEARHEVAVLLLGRSAPHIVHIHQVYETRSEYIIILEFGAGGDLQRLLDDQIRFQEKTVKELLIQILKGLSFLHGQRIAHLDIKPQNLVLMNHSTDDELKLVDFGLSRVIHQDTELTQIMGTPDYVAPEIINFEAVGLGTDMWSIGVLTYVFLTGYTPFGGDTDQETFVNITQGDYDFPDDYFTGVSEQAKDFISGLLIKSPGRRMSVEQCLSHPWLCGLYDPHRLSQLSEADSADSGYSTDPCTGSPPSPDAMSNEFVPELYQCSIPEESIISSPPYSSPGPQFYPNFPEEDNSRERRHRLSSAHLSINVLECLQNGGQRSKPLRRSSLVIPRYSSEESDRDFNANQTYNALFPTDDDYEGTWNNNSMSRLDFSSSPLADSTVAKPWANLCNGSYTRALNQLNTKSSPKNKKNPRTNLGLHPELSCSMFELKPNYDNLNSIHPDLRASKSDIRKSKTELRVPKGDSKKALRGSRQDLKEVLRSSRQDLQDVLRGSRQDLKEALRGSHQDLRLNKKETLGSLNDIHVSNSSSRSPCKKLNSRNDLRGSKSDLRTTPKKDTKSSRNNLLNDQTIARLNMSLSRLDLANQSLEESEERDVVYGDFTLPRRFSRSSKSPMLQGNSFHMSFRRHKKKDTI